jgi:hypothetical protein
VPPRIWRTGAFLVVAAGAAGSDATVGDAVSATIPEAAAGAAVEAARRPPAPRIPICKSQWRRVRRRDGRPVCVDRASGADIGVSS